MGEIIHFLFFAAIVGLVYFAGFWHGYTKAGVTVINIVNGELARLRVSRTPTGGDGDGHVL